MIYHPDDFHEIPVPYAVFEVIMNEDRSQVVDTRYVFVNEKYCEMDGRTPEEFLGRTFKSVYPDAEDHWFGYCYRAAVKGETVHDRLYEPLIGHWLDFTVAPVVRKNCVAYTFTIVDREQELLAAEKRDKQTGQIILRMTRILNGEEDYENSLNHVLRELSRIIHPDRIYILETDQLTASNTFEWCAPGVTPEIMTLQNMNYKESIQSWEKFSENQSSVVLPDITVLREKDPQNYEILKRQRIKRLIAVPMHQEGRLIGYLAADNYEESDRINTQRVLEMVSFFVGAKIMDQRLILKLEHMSHYDMLTGVHNRNAMIDDSEKIAAQSGSIGVVYADVNDLKKINDEQGHHAGDKAICLAAETLSEVFGSVHIYREGGDEFTVLLPGISKEQIDRKYRLLLARIKHQSEFCIAVGSAWDEDAGNLKRTIHRAEQQMYENKAEYYKHHDRRRG
ncbi:MAG: diguanylate cyclase domain-containing protein [Eubacterium sp.]